MRIKTLPEPDRFMCTKSIKKKEEKYRGVKLHATHETSAVQKQLKPKNNTDFPFTVSVLQCAENSNICRTTLSSSCGADCRVSSAKAHKRFTSSYRNTKMTSSQITRETRFVFFLTGLSSLNIPHRSWRVTHASEAAQQWTTKEEGEEERGGRQRVKIVGDVGQRECEQASLAQEVEKSPILMVSLRKT